MRSSSQKGLRAVRFKLISLLWGTLCVGSGAALWHNSAPWYFEREFRVDSGTHESTRCNLRGVSPDGKWVHAALKEVKGKKSFCSTIVWNVESGLPFRIELAGGENGFCLSEFSSDSKLLLSELITNERYVATIWDVEKQKEVSISKIKDLHIGNADLSPDNRCVLAWLKNGTVVLVDIQRDITVLELREVVWAQLSSSGDRIVVHCEDESIRIYETVSGRELYRLRSPIDWKFGMHRYNSARFLFVHATLTEHDSIETESSNVIRFDLNEPDRPVVVPGALLNVSPDESLGVFSDEREFRIVDLKTGSVNTRVESSTERVNFEWMEDNSKIFDTLRAELFYTASGHRIYRVDGYGHTAVFPDKSRFLNSKECIRLYALEDGELLQEMPLEEIEFFTTAVITSDSLHFVTQNEKTNAIHYWSQRRPEIWWGLAWMPEFWLFLIFSVAFIHSVRSGIPALFSALWRDLNSAN